MTDRRIPNGHVHDAGHTVGASTGNTPWERRRAVRTAAHHAVDAAECELFLAVLGLDPVEGKRAEEVA